MQTSFLSLIVQYLFGGAFTQFENSTERRGILSQPYRLFWSSKYLTPFRTVMSTPGSRCKPPANKIVEPLTFTTGKIEIRGKVVLSQ